MNKYFLILLLILPTVSQAKELSDKVVTTLSRSNEIRTITLIDDKVRSVDNIIRDSDDFSRGCWTDYGDFQIVTLTSKSGDEVFTYKCSKGDYKALSKSAEKHIEVAKGFALSAILHKNKLLKK